MRRLRMESFFLVGLLAFGFQRFLQLLLAHSLCQACKVRVRLLCKRPQARRIAQVDGVAMMVNAHSSVARLDAVSANYAPFPIGLVMRLVFTVHGCAPFLVLVGLFEPARVR